MAAAISILVELTAKPWTERRKERLLRVARERDEQIAQLAYLETKYRTAPYRLGTVWDVNSLLRELDEDLAKYSNQHLLVGDWASKPVRDLLSIGLGVTRGMVAASVVVVDHARETMGEGLAAEQYARDSTKAVLRLASGFLDVPLRYALTPKWRISKRAALSKQAKRLVRNRDNFVRETIARNQADILAARRSGQGG
ncbi:hypothetical protein ACF09Y_11700 [Streptomyces massasporeus]|uniref:hypothetical protein n=1 Tax=Streptomyces massasporeus TaxID=67324 RepID=UPI0036F64B14